MKVKGNEKILLDDEEELLIEKSNNSKQKQNYSSGVLKIKTAIGKMRKQEDSQYRDYDPKRFKK